MQPAIREYYHLEELWGDKPVRMKIGGPPAFAQVPRSAKRKVAPVRPRAGGAHAGTTPGKKVAGPKAAGRKAAGKKPGRAATGARAAAKKTGTRR